MVDKLHNCVVKHTKRIADAFEYLWKNPETGYKEWKSHKYLADAFRELGYSLHEAGNIPGFYTDVDTGRPGPTVAVFGELDGLICPGHPDADPETGAVHACGHCGQGAALLGLAAALTEPEALAEMSGKIRLVAVPAEELIETGFRQELRDQGIIRYFGGKQEFLYRGYLDGVDMCFMFHNSGMASTNGGFLNSGSNGMMTKQLTFLGVSAHAGASPHKGVNALYAANQAMSAINALRETFQDKHHVRVHPILTFAGSSVNAIPDRVEMECYVRAADGEAIQDVNERVNRAAAASAAAIGAKLKIVDNHGYFPRIYDKGMMQVCKEAMDLTLDEVKYNPDGFSTGCSDLGDMTAIMPAVHPAIGGCFGKAHGNDYGFTDGPATCVSSARVQLAMLWLLLRDDAARAKQILTEHKYIFPSKEAYLTYVDSLTADIDAVQYREDGSVVLLPKAGTIDCN